MLRDNTVSLDIGLVMEGRLCRWALALQEFDFTIEYRRGSSNANADALSRVPTIPSTCAGIVTVPELNTLEDVAQEQGKDEVLNEVRCLVSSGLSNQPRHWNQHPIQKFSRIRSQCCVVDGALCNTWTIREGENCTSSCSLQPSRPTMTS